MDKFSRSIILYPLLSSDWNDISSSEFSMERFLLSFSIFFLDEPMGFSESESD